jgi:hypothetical protein
MDYLIMLKKAVLGFFTGLAAVIVLGVVKSVTDYVPVTCTAEITTDCMPGYIVALYYSIVPTVCAFLVGVANWLKNRDK